MEILHIDSLLEKHKNVLDVTLETELVDVTNPFNDRTNEFYIKDSKETLIAFILWLRNDIKLKDRIGKKLYKRLMSVYHDRRLRLITYLDKLDRKDLVITYSKDKDLASIYKKMLGNELWYNPKSIKNREFVFVTHIPKTSKNGDYHLVKERLILNDGSIRPNLRYIKDYQVPFWVTKSIFRNHKQKKEFEDLKKVDKHYSTVSEFANAVGTKLRGRPYSRNNLRDSRPSPYIYGGDVASNVHMKIEYMEKYGEAKSAMSYCALDTENDIETGELTAITVAMNRKVALFVTQELVKDVKGDVVAHIRKAFYERTLKEYKKKGINYHIDEIKLDITVCLNSAIAVDEAFKVVHGWKPDMVGIWNIQHDMPLMIKMLENRGMRPEDTFCDPTVPKHMRYMKFHQGSLTSPKGTPLSGREQWHTYTFPASFFILDAMSTYHFIRVGGNQQVGGYGIDNVLDKNLGLGKLKMKEGGTLEGKDWHNHMSKKHPVLYAVYNIWDTFAMVLLDEYTNDVSISITPLSVLTPLRYFNSGPRRIVDKLYYESLKSGYIIGTKDLYNPNPDKILGMGKWIVTLEAFRTIDKGLSVIAGLPNGRTNVTPATSDIDATSSYPSDTVAGNISMSTTKTEIISMQGIGKEDFKRENMNIVYGPVNSNRYVNNMFNTPDIYSVDKYFAEQLNKKAA